MGRNEINGSKPDPMIRLIHRYYDEYVVRMMALYAAIEQHKRGCTALVKLSHYEYRK